ncbi:MAG: oligosaccharide flippase family protein [Planctomycetota bacterium]
MTRGPLTLESTTAVADAPTSSAPPPLRGRAVRATAWTMLGFGGREALRLLSSLVLTRLLWPGAYGLMALTNIFITGLQMFSDIGIGPSIIQNSRGTEPRFLNTAWTIQCVRGAVLTVVACLLAYPVAWFFESPMLAPLILATSVAPLLSGFFSTSLITRNRELDMRRLTIVELVTQATSIAVMLGSAVAIHGTIAAGVDHFVEGSQLPLWFEGILAEIIRTSLITATVWALVVGALAVAIVRLVMSHRYLPGIRNRFQWDRSAAQDLFGFGRWVFLSTLLTFLAQWADRLVIGKCFSADALGYYAIAAIFAAIPTSVVSAVAGRVMLPTYSKAKHDGRDLAAVFGRVRRPVLTAGAILVSGLVALGEPAIALLYDPRYQAAGTLVALLSIASWFQILEIANSQALLAIGRVKSMAAGHLTKVVGLAVGMPLGYYLCDGALVGMVAGLIVADAAKYAVTAVAVARQGLHGWRTDFVLSAIAAGIVAGSLAIAPYWEELTSNAWLAFTLASFAIVAAWLPFLVPIVRDLRGRGIHGG